MTPTRIVFFDGDCAFCNRTVRWIIRRDRRQQLRFAPLQGETYAALNIPGKPTDLSTIVFYEDGRIFTRSSATHRMLSAVGGVYSVPAALLRVTPRPIRDWFYNLIARNRRRLAKANTCMAPSPEMRARLLP